MSPFQPAGVRARWLDVYDVLKAAKVGDIITYEQLGEALELNATTDRHKIQMAVRRAAQEHEKADKRALDSVKNVGYRIVDAPEHVMLARRHQSKAFKALVRGHSKAVNVDFGRVDAETRKALETIAQGFALQMDFNRRFDIRQSRLEEAVSQASTRVERTEQEIAKLIAQQEELKARLDRQEQAD